MAETITPAPVKRGPGRPRKTDTAAFPPAKPVENGAAVVEPITYDMPEIAIGDYAIVTDELGTDVGAVTFIAKSAKHHIIIVKVG